jgi:hypothetical protein
MNLSETTPFECQVKIKHTIKAPIVGQIVEKFEA